MSSFDVSASHSRGCYDLEGMRGGGILSSFSRTTIYCSTASTSVDTLMFDPSVRKTAGERFILLYGHRDLATTRLTLSKISAGDILR